MGDRVISGTTPSRPQSAWLRVVAPPLVLALWLALVRVLPDSFKDPDVTRLQSLTIVTVLGWVFVAGAVAVASPRLPAEEQRWIVRLLRMVLIVPIGFSLMWSAQRLMLPVPVRVDGEVPDLVALLGRTEPEVALALGTAQRLPDRNPATLRPVIAPVASARSRAVAYRLPDLDTRANSGARRALEGIPLQLLQRLKAAPEHVESDAVVVVYFSSEGGAVAAHLELTREAAGDLLGPGWLDRLPAVSGLVGELLPADPPKWTAGEKPGDAAATDRWGFCRRARGFVAYHLRTLQRPPAMLRNSDETFVALTVGDGLLDPLPQPEVASVSDTAPRGEEQTRGSVSGRAATVGATQDFSGRTFFVVDVGEERSEAAAWRRADELNERASAAGETSPTVTVERSGHLQGIGDGDYFVLVHTVGFDNEDDAVRRARGLAWKLRVLPKTSRIMKRCGSLTFVAVQ